MKKQRKRFDEHLNIMVAIAILITGILAIVFTVQMKNYEKGILDICASQQDTYVQLVLDQINLNQNREDDEIIQDILGTLDTSSDKYWTFSKEQSILFVKNVMETNKYKGLTAASYYGESESALDFLSNLQVNRVTHAQIDLGGTEYIASGVAFLYQKNTYRLCLLTDADMLMNNNKFLEAKIGLYVIITILFITLVSLVICFVNRMHKLSAKIKQSEARAEMLNNAFTEYNRRMTLQDFLDMRKDLWKIGMLKKFLLKLSKRDNYPILLVELLGENEQAIEETIAKANYLFGKNALRFQVNARSILMLFVGIEKEKGLAELKYAISRQIELGEVYYWTKDLDEIEIEKIASKYENGDISCES